MCAKNYKKSIFIHDKHLRVDRVVINELNEFLRHLLDIRDPAILLHIMSQKLDHLSVKQIIESAGLFKKSHK